MKTNKSKLFLKSIIFALILFSAFGENSQASDFSNFLDMGSSSTYQTKSSNIKLYQINQNNDKQMPIPSSGNDGKNTGINVTEILYPTSDPFTPPKSTIKIKNSW